MNNQELPEPLTTIDDNVDGLDGFLLNVQKLMASELWALADGIQFKASVGLWCRAWTQKPAGSLPNNHKVLAAFSGAGDHWNDVKEMALRGFVLCSDGRLYHTTLCEDVKRASAAKKKRAGMTKAATEARTKKRNDERNVQRNDDATLNVTLSHRIELEEEGSKKEPPIAPQGGRGGLMLKTSTRKIQNGRSRNSIADGFDKIENALAAERREIEIARSSDDPCQGDVETVP